ncbi:MAG TPA: delta-60 repeat domain-containing protein, partial [Pilimelia sp.]|nr:delta-60 repeat domain-containing protein [Pilimelia sp.]
TEVALVGGARSVALAPDGTTLVAGSASPWFAGPDDTALARYRADGTLDPGFGRGGVVVTDLSRVGDWDGAAAVALDADGRILVLAWARSANAFPRTLALARFLPAGGPDAGFGHGGVVLWPSPGSGYAYLPVALAVQPDGAILTASVDTWARYVSRVDLLRFRG